MAAGTILKILKIKDEASPQLKKVGDEADTASDKLKGTEDSAGGAGVGMG